jgi:excisionase family DNA binding protein
VNLDGHVTWSNPEGRLTMTIPEAAKVLHIGRDACYAAAKRGEIPTLTLGRRIVVPTAKLFALLGLAAGGGTDAT